MKGHFGNKPNEGLKSNAGDGDPVISSKLLNMKVRRDFNNLAVHVKSSRCLIKCTDKESLVEYDVKFIKTFSW